MMTKLEQILTSLKIKRPPYGKFRIFELDIEGKKVWEETRATYNDAAYRLSIRKSHRPKKNTFIIEDTETGERWVDI